MREDTIVAISTAAGAGAIGVVRLSGPEAIAIAMSGFQPAGGRTFAADETYTVRYGRVLDPTSGEVLDEALLLLMRGPRSYTREDVVELQCHGGPAAQRAVLRLLLRLGARLAEPGEFTRRAFLNGRIDLAQAESVAAIVSARSSMALRASVRQLEGGLSRRVRGLRKHLVGLMAEIEAALDFSDENVGEVDWTTVSQRLAGAHEELERLLSTAFLGRVLEHGLRTAIVGRPNAGKSSLLNALLMRERAIVSPIPGTTRDTVEEALEIGGLPIHLVDTAGLRSGGGQVEQLGVERSMRAMESADLVVMVIDLAVEREEEERSVLRMADPARWIVVGNKADLLEGGVAEGERRLAGFMSVVDGDAALDGERRQQTLTCVVSALTGEGLEELRRVVEAVATGGSEVDALEPVLATERHRALVEEAALSVGAAMSRASGDRAEELVSEDIRAAAEALGRITGEDLGVDLLDEIFGRFCLGK